MRNSLSLPILLLATMIAPRPAFADFAVLNNAEAQPANQAPPPHIRHAPPGRPPKHAAHKPQRPQYAVGFGRRIPLAFAVRQIVPHELQIRYGDTAIPDTLVDWQGGRRWPAVLRDAVNPLGLRVKIHDRLVSISK